jgi:hypothetical protein
MGVLQHPIFMSRESFRNEENSETKDIASFHEEVRELMQAELKQRQASGEDSGHFLDREGEKLNPFFHIEELTKEDQEMWEEIKEQLTSETIPTEFLVRDLNAYRTRIIGAQTQGGVFERGQADHQASLDRRNLETRGTSRDMFYQFLAEKVQHILIQRGLTPLDKE